MSKTNISLLSFVLGIILAFIMQGNKEIIPPKVLIPDTTYNTLYRDSIIYNIKRKDTTIYNIKNKEHEIKEQVDSTSNSDVVELFKELSLE